MTKKLYLLLFAASLMSGCYVHSTARFYPVQGPLSAQSPAPVATAHLTGAFRSGNMSLSLNDNELFKGRWAQTSTTPGDPMASVWDAVYGHGFFVSHVLGAGIYAQALLTGNRGTKLNVEMYRTEADDPGRLGVLRGVAKDDKGNIYKIASF
jgi:hypothetical protein